MKWAWLLLIALLCGASLAGPTPVQREGVAPVFHGAGKTEGPVALAVRGVERAADGETFRLTLRVLALADHDAITVLAWGGEGIGVDGPGAFEVGPGRAGRALELALSGTWSGDGIPRVYAVATMRAAGEVRPGFARMSVDVSEKGYVPPGRGRLDTDAGVIVLEAE
ncbi:MAG: hypothetical protein P8080_13605 [Gammaproteobacteria bacterium]